MKVGDLVTNIDYPGEVGLIIHMETKAVSRKGFNWTFMQVITKGRSKIWAMEDCEVVNESRRSG